MRQITEQGREAASRAAAIMLSKWSELLRDVVDEACEGMNISDPNEIYDVQEELEWALRQVRDEV